MDARDVVTSRIAEQARRFPDLVLAPLDVSALDARDAGLAAAIDHAVMRHWLTLVRVIESRLARSWAELEAKLQAALLVGAAQLLYLERLPDHAVLDEAVKWTKRRVRPKAGGLVNAVLRKVAALRVEVFTPSARDAPGRDELPLPDGRAWKLNEEVFDAAPQRRLAQQTSHPETLIMQWTSAYGADQARTLALHSIVHAPIIVHGLKREAGSDVLQPHEDAGFFVFTGDRTGLLQLLQRERGAIVQDVTSAAPVRATNGVQPSPSLIIDACAGRGTKTRQLAASHPSARIIATDVDQTRLQTLRDVFASDDRVEVIECSELARFSERVDLLLLDVPCSNTGVLARRVEAKYRHSRASMEKVANLQRQIIADSLPLLSPSGRLVYSTCSIERQENEDMAQWLCKWHPMRLAREERSMPQGLPGDSRSTYRDGGYFAIFERSTK